MPFAKAATMLESFTRVAVSEDYVQEHTEAAGAAQVALQAEAVEHLERETPPAPPGPDKLYLSADGAFVPLVGGAWEEVKTLVIGEVAAPVLEKGEKVVHTQHLSYFSRLANVDTFTRLALVETHRRGVETAGQVGAVLDGAEWLQMFVNFHRPDALRILDFPHAGGYVGKIGQATFGAASPELAVWFKAQLHDLKHQGPDEVLAELRDMVLEHPQAEALELPKNLAYLEKRKPQLQYPTFQAQGWPIGSGATESGNKLVVEARLKGAGMHWARTHVDPMLALRNVVCNDRWDEAWPQIVVYLRRQAAAQRAERQSQRRAESAARRPTQAVPVELIPAAQPLTREQPP
ncbi:MAG: ISKra4 family transposase, partial [Nanoarchaeota archaeon]